MAVVDFPTWWVFLPFFAIGLVCVRSLWQSPRIGETWWYRIEEGAPPVRVLITEDHGVRQEHVVDGTCRMEFRKTHVWGARVIETGEEIRITSDDGRLVRRDFPLSPMWRG